MGEQGAHSREHNAFPVSKSFSLKRSTDSSQQQNFARSVSFSSASCHRASFCLSGDYSAHVIGNDELGRGPSQNMSSRIRESFSLSRDLVEELLGDADGSVSARAGDSGGWVMEDENEEMFASHNDDLVQKGAVFATNDEKLVGSSPMSSPAGFSSPLPSDAILHVNEKNLIEVKRSQSLKGKNQKLAGQLDYASYLIHMAVFGILGVFTRYLLQKLFGPSCLKLTGDDSPLYLDLPSNILGSFLMGWFGVIFKADLANVSDHIVVGLTTGYLGSLTTFSGWNMKMLDLATKDRWVFALGGIILGMAIVNESIRFGVESAEGLRRILVARLNKGSGRTKHILKSLKVNTRTRHASVMMMMLLVLGTLWGLSGALAKLKLDSVSNGAVLWLGCLVAPPGVWARWHLARLNGQGLGSKGFLKWLPVGTLAANVLAACIVAALATISKAVNTKRCSIIVSGVQFGFLGCLSTVSTLVAEVFAMRQSGHIGRAVAYISMTILLSFSLGTLIYSVPVWVKNYN